MKYFFPNLQIVKVKHILFHEEVDPNRIKHLTAKIKKDGILINPPIVAPNDKKYILLDGANRVSALQVLGYNNILVQVVDYKRVELKTWQHVVCGLNQDSFKRQVLNLIKQTQGQVHLSSIQRKTKILPQHFLSWVIFGQNGYKIKRQGSFSKNLLLLNRLTKLYKGQTVIHRVEPNITINQIRCNYPNFIALLKFTRFTPQDVKQAAQGKVKLPGGITRHILPIRALKVRLPLSLLSLKKSLKIKNQELEQFLQMKVKNNQVRLYQEPVWIFDE